jgi:putative chitinase
VPDMIADIEEELKTVIAKIRAAFSAAADADATEPTFAEIPEPIVTADVVSGAVTPVTFTPPVTPVPIPSPLTLLVMRRMWPHGNQHVPKLIEGIAENAGAVFTKYKMNSPLLIAHAMAQFSEECGCGLEMEENMNYSATRLRQVFPTHFPTWAMAERYAGNPRMIADVAYGGRMGNAPPPSDDGWNFRGRGLSQVTGREGYANLSAKTGLSLLADPSWLSAPAHALECGVADFVLCGCLPYAAEDDVVMVTRRLNGGLNGLVVRREWLVRWKGALR